MTDNSDRRALLAIILSLGVYFVWSAFFAPPPPVGPPAEPTAPIAAEPDAAGSTAGPATASAPAVTPGLAAPEPDIPEHAEDLTTASWGAQVSSRGGALGEVALADFRKPKVVVPLWEWGLARVTGKAESGWEPYTGGEDPYGLLEGGGLGLAGAGDLADSGNFQVTRSGDVVTAQRRRADGLVITTTYTPGEGPYSLDVTVQYDNGTGKPVGDLWVGVAEPMSGEAGRFLNAVRPLVHSDGDVEHVEDLEDLDGSANERFEGPIQWYGVGDRYFMAVLVPDADPGAVVTVDTLPDGRTGAFWVQSQTLDAGASRTVKFTSYLGPKDLDLLKPLGHDLADAVEFGIFGLFSKLLLFLLELFQGFVVNWGVAIILLTFLVKLAFFPLTQRAFKSSRKMQALQPRLNAMREKYKDNQQLQTEETMKLFKEHGVNPLGGCLPTLIQLPVWFALYNTMLYSVEIYDTSFAYLQDLTAVDPYGIIPTLYAGLMIGQQRMMPMGSMDETQQKVLKAMPLIFAFFMFSFPSGLVLYFIVNMSLTILQQWWIKRTIKDVPAAA